MEFIDIETLKHRLKVLYILDNTLIPPENDYLRLVQYDENEEYKQYIINNGLGDVLMVRFMEQGVFIKGFDHENELNQFAADEWNNGY